METGDTFTGGQLVASLFAQVKKLRFLLLAVYIPTFLVLVASIIISLEDGIPHGALTREPHAEFEAPVYIGAVSNIGVLVWCATAAVCLLTFVALFRWGDWQQQSLFFLYWGVFSAWLMFDDLFRLHEKVIPNRTGIPQWGVMAIYFLVVAVGLLAFRKTFLRTEYLPLIIAIGFFGFSLVIDEAFAETAFYLTFIADGFEGRHLLEDGSKMVGISSWFAYFWQASVQQIRPRLQPPLQA